MVFLEIPGSQCCQQSSMDNIYAGYVLSMDRLSTADLSAVPCFTWVLEANNKQLCTHIMQGLITCLVWPTYIFTPASCSYISLHYGTPRPACKL